MKIQSHHLDIAKPPKVIVKLPFMERMRIQVEMIQDHAYLNGLPFEQAIISWVDKGWAYRFDLHYLTKKS